MQSYLKSNEKLDHYDELSKATFLSYFISLYISTIEDKNRHDSVSVNEIYDFILDLQDELDFKVPHVAKRDISLCFYILDKLGVCSCLK
jgi:hypothetical protein